MNRSKPDTRYLREIVESLVDVDDLNLVSELTPYSDENRRFFLLSILKREMGLAAVSTEPEGEPGHGEHFFGLVHDKYAGEAAFEILVHEPRMAYLKHPRDEWPLRCENAVDCLGMIYAEDVGRITSNRPAGFTYEIDVPYVRDRNKRGGRTRKVVTVPSLLKSFFELDSLRGTPLKRYLVACYNYLVAEDMTRPLEKLEPVTFTNYGAPLGTVRARPYSGLSGGDSGREEDDFSNGLSGGPRGKRSG